MIRDDVIWVDVYNYEGIYKISNYGDVFSVRSNKILKPEVMNKGYLRVGLNLNGTKERVMVHRLVMYSFVGYRKYPDFEVNHINMKTDDNYLKNLEWCTGKENTNKAFETSPNRLKNAMRNMSEIGKKYGRIGIEASKKPVVRISKDGKNVKIYESARDAVKDGFNYKCISSTCYGHKKTHLGYMWKFLSEYKDEEKGLFNEN